MSTTYLQQVVDAAKSKYAVDGFVADMALIELDAIHQAAKAWSSRGAVVPPEQMNNFWSLLEAIAKDAP